MAHAAPVALGDYKPRRPQASPLFRLVSDHLHRLQTVYDDRFAREYGPWRPVVAQEGDKFLACGVLEHGFVRIRCDDCAHEYLLAFCPGTLGTERHAPSESGPPGPLSIAPTPRRRAGTFDVRGAPVGRRIGPTRPAAPDVAPGRTADEAGERGRRHAVARPPVLARQRTTPYTRPTPIEIPILRNNRRPSRVVALPEGNPMWASMVELVRATIFAGAHLFGGSLGASVVLVSALVRLALLPLALRSARFARAQQAKLAALQPQLERLQKRYANDPKRLWTETQALHRANGIQMFTAGSLVSQFIQLPLIGALFSAVRNGLGARVRFLWIADLSRVDAILLVLVAGVAGVSASVAPSAPAAQSMQRMMTVVAIGGTLLFLWSASSAVALSVGAGSAVNLLQNWLLARDAKRIASPAT